MLIWGLAQLAGAILLLFQPILPHPGIFLLTVPPVLAMLAAPRWRWVVALWLGAALAAWQADRNLDDRLAQALDGQVVEMSGRIVGLIEDDGRRQRFRFRIESGSFRGEPVALPREVRLNLYDPLDIATGEHWQWRAKLRRPRGFANAGGFDYERWLFAEGIGATGYVRDVHDAKRLDAGDGEWRADVAARVAALVDGPAAGLVRGLATGDRGGITDHQWDVLRRTGTAHLAAISGLHIALVTGLVFALAAFVRRRAWPSAGLYWPALAGGLAGLVYGALAGFELPVQRALVAAGVVLFALALRRRVAAGHVFGSALAAVLCLDPLAPLDAGFWLSFGAVAAILFSLGGRRPAGSRLRRALFVQAGLFVLMAPLVLATFGRVPLLSPFANLIAVPVFDGFVVPLVLLGLLLLPWPDAASAWLAVPAWALERLFALLETFAALDPGWVPPSLPAWALLGATLGFLLVSMPRAVPGKALACGLLLPAAWLSVDDAQRPPLVAHFLDVGQGLAVVLETPSRTLVYDTGPAFGDSDAASLVVIPFLESRGREPDFIMISHGDNDHAGGLAALMERYPDARVAGRLDDGMAGGVEDCADLAWNWDGTAFRVLHPPSGHMADNESSCVLHVATDGFSLLLTGDIEAAAESRLLREHSDMLDVDVALVPHHGSRTSSMPPFVARVDARIAIASAGHGNQWGFPKDDVVKRWEDSGASVLVTGAQGAISVTFDTEAFAIDSYRNARRLWREPAAMPGTLSLPRREPVR